MRSRPALTVVMAAALLLGVEVMAVRFAHASTYVVYIPLTSPIYEELDKLNGLGYLDTYLSEIKPISRVEAARLTLEAQRNLAWSERPNHLAKVLVAVLRSQLQDEVGWLQNQAEDGQPTTFHPLQSVGVQYIYTSGERRFWDTGGVGGLHAREGTPLLPHNDGIPTAHGSNEVLTWSGWAGFAGLLTTYGQAAITGPVTHSLADGERFRLINGEAVLGLGNWALSFGQEEMWWGTGHFAALSQGDNAAPFPALRIQKIHPSLLPGIFSYLGQFRFQGFFGQLDSDRYFAHPWLVGQIFSFKPLPDFEFGFTHTIMFGGRFNDHYSPPGFLGRATGFSTGSPQTGNTNSRAGVYLKFYFPSLRNLEVYQEILGEDNLTYEVPAIGRFLPFLAVSYQGGFYLPRLTQDGLTDLRFEYAILEPNYSIHGDSLYWTYNGWLMGDPLGPNATEVDLAASRWFRTRSDITKFTVDLFYTEQAPNHGANVSYPPSIYGPNLAKEHSGGAAFDLLAVSGNTGLLNQAPGYARIHVALECAQALNYAQGQTSLRVLAAVSGSLSMDMLKWSF